MTLSTLRCRACGVEHATEPVGICPKCFGPLDPVYDLELAAKTLTREALGSRPATLWRYHELLPAGAQEDNRLPVGFTPLVSAPRLAEAVGVGELWLKLDTANPTHSFKDRVVAVAAAKAKEFGFSTIACSSTGNLANAVAARAAVEGLEAVVFVPADLEPEKLVATAVYGATLYAINGSYDDCSRLNVELSFELPWGFVNTNLRAYYAEGSKTLGFEIAEQLGWELPDAVIAPVASGALYSKTAQGLRELAEIGLVQGRFSRFYGGQAEGCARVASAFAEDRSVTPVRPNTIARSLAIGNPADGALALETARATGGAVYATPEDQIGENMGLLAETTGIFGETAAGATLGALRVAVSRGELGARDRVVLLVTGDGLKTPGPIEHRLQPIEIEPDADALLERLGVTV